MKKCSRITGWTDYPITQLGDIPGELAPIRRVQVIAYDGDKYVEARILGWDVTESIKRGYVYGKRGRCGQVRPINGDKIRRAFGYDTLARYYAKRGTKIKRNRYGGFTFL